MSVDVSPAGFWPSFIEAKGATLRGAVDGLKITEGWSADELRAGQQAQLTQLLKNAAKNVPWYGRAAWMRPLLAAIDSDAHSFWAQWLAIPPLSKPELREHAGLLNARNLPAAHLPLGSTVTSGSTGIPVKVSSTTVSRLTWSALTVREHQWRQRDFDKRLGIARVRKDQPGTSGVDKPNWGPPVAMLFPTGTASLINIGVAVEHLIAWLQRFDPHYFLTHPSLAAELLEQLGSGGRNPSLEEVRLMSEPLDAELSARLSDTWNVRVADVYSANETGNIAFRCNEDRLHVQSEAVLVEIVDDSGRPCAPGESGRVLLTALHNIATPLIRYDIGDYAKFGAPCPCGRAHPVIEQVLGRVRNMAVAPDGKRYWPTSLVALRSVQAVRQLQFVQTAIDTIELRLVLQQPLTPDEEKRIAATACRILGHPYRIVISSVAAIERGPGGKFEEFLSLVVPS